MERIRFIHNYRGFKLVVPSRSLGSKVSYLHKFLIPDMGAIRSWGSSGFKLTVIVLYLMSCGQGRGHERQADCNRSPIYSSTLRHILTLCLDRTSLWAILGSSPDQVLPILQEPCFHPWSQNHLISDSQMSLPLNWKREPWDRCSLQIHCVPVLWSTQWLS